jgi:hypothetical protein
MNKTIGCLRKITARSAAHENLPKHRSSPNAVFILATGKRADIFWSMLLQLSECMIHRFSRSAILITLLIAAARCETSLGVVLGVSPQV